MSNQEMQGGAGPFVIKAIIGVVVFIALVTYIVKQNGDSLL
jgi:hypothetical protein